MKKLMKFISCIMVFILLASVSGAAFAADSSQLMFSSSGDFVILQFADCQDVYPAREAMVTFINEALDNVQPNLVVFTGDNVVTDNLMAFDEILNPVVSRGLPFTFCFGNHDQESNPEKTHEDLLAVYQTYPGCLAYDADPALSGCATHNLPILSSDGSRVAFNIWMFDSGDYMQNKDGVSGYSCVREDQVEWYINKSMQLESENGGLVPSIAFQHIIPQEGYEIFYKSLLPLGEASKNFDDGSSYTYLPDFTKFDGYIFEPPCPSQCNFGQWNAFVERGDVLALAVGHDHTNSFVADISGVDMINTPGCTWNSYGNNLVRGCRVFTINENDPWTYETEVIRAADLAIKEGSQIPGKEDSLFTYHSVVILSDLLESILLLIKSFNFSI
ncbi:MAG: hypothetical protein BWY46_01915 [Firmicutes bacterium ADurb.Bin300]|nr:MAG: hypothetical protein BWY46_01915 [Firmicutes bacterium ADurb.Bin300]